MNKTLIKIGVVIFYRRGHGARSARSCNFGCISGMKEFYDKPHIHFEDSSI